MLTGRGLRKRFGLHEVLKGVDIEVDRGAITAIVGPSGGGKSTLLRTLALLEPAEAGSVQIDGVACSWRRNRNVDGASPWPAITVVFQQLFLWPHMTLRDSIELPLRLRGVSPEDRDVPRLLETFELNDIAMRYPNEVSIGQRQRAALVRALALRPRYLLLDEITSALDVEHVSRVLDELERQRDSGTGILLVTHLIGFASKAATSIYFLDAGAVVEHGSAGILTQPRTERLARFLSLVETAR